jgi:hypothetical protein
MYKNLLCNRISVVKAPFWIRVYVNVSTTNNMMNSYIFDKTNEVQYILDNQHIQYSMFPNQYSMLPKEVDFLIKENIIEFNAGGRLCITQYVLLQLI